MLRLASFQWKLLRAVSFLPEKSSKLNENSSFVKHFQLLHPSLPPSPLASLCYKNLLTKKI
ncbi:unnamed protein product [Brassica oleracea]